MFSAAPSAGGEHAGLLALLSAPEHISRRAATELAKKITSGSAAAVLQDLQSKLHSAEGCDREGAATALEVLAGTCSRANYTRAKALSCDMPVNRLLDFSSFSLERVLAQGRPLLAAAGKVGKPIVSVRLNI